MNNMRFDDFLAEVRFLLIEQNVPPTALTYSEVKAAHLDGLTARETAEGFVGYYQMNLA